MRAAGGVTLVLAASLLAPAPGMAQQRPVSVNVSTRRGAYDIRDQIKANWAKKRRGRNGSSEPTGTNANAAGFRVPQGEQPPPPTRAGDAPEAFPTFKPGKTQAPSSSPPPSSGTATAPAPQPTRPPRPARPKVPIVPGLRAPSVRKIETPEDLEEFEKVQRIRKAASVRMAVNRAARTEENPTEMALVRRVLGALDMPAPTGAEELRETGLRVRPNQLEAGDLLFFQIPHGGKLTEHVAVFFGDDRFAYVGPRGVSLAPLNDTWRERLLMVRRPR